MLIGLIQCLFTGYVIKILTNKQYLIEIGYYGITIVVIIIMQLTNEENINIQVLYIRQNLYLIYFSVIKMEMEGNWIRT